MLHRGHILEKWWFRPRSPYRLNVVIYRGAGLLFGVYKTHPFGLFRKL